MSDWIEWKGGPSPVTYGQVVEVQYRIGDTDKGSKWDLNILWEHMPEFSGADIIAYRIIEDDK